MSEKIGVVLLNLGGPDSLDAVEPFLFNLFSDPDIIDFPGSFLFRKRLAKLISTRRSPGVIKQYEEIGGKSPLKDYTLQQAALLEQKLNEQFAGESVRGDALLAAVHRGSSGRDRTRRHQKDDSACRCIRSSQRQRRRRA